MSQPPTYYRGLTAKQLAAWITGACGVIISLAGVGKIAKNYFDATYVTVAAYRSDMAALHERYVADSVHHAIDDRVNARVQRAVDSIETSHQKPSRGRVLQAGEPR